MYVNVHVLEHNLYAGRAKAHAVQQECHGDEYRCRLAALKAQIVPEPAIALFAPESLLLAGLALLVFAVLHVLFAFTIGTL